MQIVIHLWSGRSSVICTNCPRWLEIILATIFELPSSDFHQGLDRILHSMTSEILSFSHLKALTTRKIVQIKKGVFSTISRTESELRVHSLSAKVFVSILKMHLLVFWWSLQYFWYDTSLKPSDLYLAVDYGTSLKQRERRCLKPKMELRNSTTEATESGMRESLRLKRKGRMLRRKDLNEDKEDKSCNTGGYGSPSWTGWRRTLALVVFLFSQPVYNPNPLSLCHVASCWPVISRIVIPKLTCHVIF